MATIVDVAKRAGVSVSTVSYAMSGARPVSQKTRQRVMQAIEELNYHPNLLARGLASKRTKIIALLFPAISRNLDELQLEFIASIAGVATEHGYGLLLFTQLSGEQEITRFAKQGLVDGLILMEVRAHDPRVSLMNELGYPFSLIGHCQNNEGISFVDMDFYLGLRECVHCLAKLEHRKIAFIPNLIQALSSDYNYIKESIRGFQTAVQELGIEGSIQGCEPTEEGGYTTMLAVLEEHPDLTAVIAGNDPIYSGVARALREKGLYIPRDISTMGMLSDRLAERYDPKVTTLKLPASEMGRIGAELLIRKLEGQEKEPQQFLLAPQMIIRQSTARRRPRT